MKKQTLKTGLLSVLAGLALLATIVAGPSLAENVQSLRGGENITTTNVAPKALKQQRSQSALPRAYRQQPPLVPHKIDGYQVDLKVNQCMGCHDWPRNVDVGAPKISETHYISRDGIALDHVARTRWFCTQCHVPQADAKPLVKNDFVNARQVKEQE